MRIGASPHLVDAVTATSRKMLLLQSFVTYARGLVAAGTRSAQNRYPERLCNHVTLVVSTCVLKIPALAARAEQVWT